VHDVDVDSAGKVVITRQLRPKLGHTSRLMPPSYVKDYVKRSKKRYRRDGRRV